MKKLAIISIYCLFLIGAPTAQALGNAIILCDGLLLKIINTDTTMDFTFKVGSSCANAIRTVRTAGYVFVSTKITKDNDVLYTFDCPSEVNERVDRSKLPECAKVLVDPAS